MSEQKRCLVEARGMDVDELLAKLAELRARNEVVERQYGTLRARVESALRDSGPNVRSASSEVEPPRLCCCSFCGANNREVAIMIAGPNFPGTSKAVFACGECVGLMVECIVNERIARPRDQRVLSGWARLTESFERANEELRAQKAEEAAREAG